MNTPRTYIGADNQVHDQFGNTYAQQGLKGTINGELGTKGTIEPPAAKPAVVTAPVTTPTVVTNANITDKKIPQINAEATKVLTPPAVAPAPDATTTEKPKDDGTGGYSDIYKSLMGDSTTDAVTDPYYKSQMDLIDSMKTSNDSIFQNTLSGIRSQYQSAYSTQEKANRESNQQVGNALLRSGSSRYAPGSSAAYMSAKNAADISALNDLHTKEQAAISEASVAKMNGDYKTLEAKLAVVKDIRAEKQAQAKTIFEQMAADAKAARDAEVKKQEEISKIAQDAAKNGASAETLDAITSAPSVNDAIKAGGDALQSGTGTVGEYLYYKRDALAHGQVPLSYNEYADMDANRKRSIVNVGGGNLSNATIGKVQQIAGQFDGEQTVKDYNTVATQVNYVQSLGKNPTDDQARVYAFAKVMDPNSAVKEGEYNTVSEYSQALLQRQGLKARRVFDNKGFLTDEARNFMQKTLEGRLATQKKSYDNVANEYGRRINKVTGTNDGKEWITDYSGGFSDTGGQIVQTEQGAQDKLVQAALTNPDVEKTVNALAGVVQQDLGRAYTWQEIAAIAGIQ